MPTVQYIYNGETITKPMLTPRKITQLNSWFIEARKAIPQIPVAQFMVSGPDGWLIDYQEADPKWIKFDLTNMRQERAYIVILRKS
jgi:hypothetical protein